MLAHQQKSYDRSFFVFFQKSDYLTLSATLLESLISRNDLMVSQEEEVFRVVMEWCEHDQESRKKHLPQLLCHVSLEKLGIVMQRFFRVTMSQVLRVSKSLSNNYDALHMAL